MSTECAYARYERPNVSEGWGAVAGDTPEANRVALIIDTDGR